MESTGSEKRKPSVLDKRFKVIITVILVLFGITIALLLRNSYLISENRKASRSWNAAKIRQHASRLKADGLALQAMRAFEEYLDKSGADAATRGNIYYSLGEMFLREDRYEDALSYFYKAEIADPATELKREIGSYIITCLEKMGKSLDAEYQLESRADLKGETRRTKASGEIVAKIGSREITMGEINEEIERLPSWMKGEYTKDESKKLEFLQQYVSSELLYDKGSKLGYTKSPEVRDQIESFSRQLVVQKVIEDEIDSKIHIDPDDVKNYYEANKEKYKDESGNVKTFEDAKYSVTLDYRMKKSQKLAQDLLSDILSSKDVDIYADKFVKKELPGGTSAKDPQEEKQEETTEGRSPGEK
jgi:tetratricopeptide (TPR) repeat protein